MKTFLFFALVALFINLTESAPLSSSECPAEKIDQIGECLKDLVSTVEKITRWVDQEYKFDKEEKKEFREKCLETQKCFSSVKTSCPDFPEAVTNELDVMCSRFNFIIEKFTDCVPKLNNLTEIECVNEVFGPKSLKKTSNEKCDSLKEHRVCARKEVENACGDKMGKVLEENFDVELKMHKC
ncbi:T20D4.11-like domain-containing protein [Caenorhabditis elegans]|uniref:T20D4.11-like domain-containing protein n=2 Tax=Caenorhabditis elegans TaxID=6239 RepID=Q9XUQ6_CAEEL|nr:DUF19 domain-containing protein [Caenorhabditis elegans]CAB04718.2 DUF19 domain-containing protein [Caenorhabditis elegans]|eukprot:NP_506485.2 Uncharacterized protein CELE_T08G5.3 [Caenorhabditis elegans]